MKTNKKDFQIFKTECKRLIDMFNLNDWEYFFDHNEAEEGANASYEANLDGMCISIMLGKEIEFIGNPDREELIKDIAAHEIIESMLVPLRIIAENRDFNEYKLEKETHAVVHRIQCALRGLNDRNR